MKLTILIAAMVLSLSACDNTKLQLRAPEPEGTNVKVAAKAQKTDTILTDTIKKDTLVSH